MKPSKLFLASLILSLSAGVAHGCIPSPNYTLYASSTSDGTYYYSTASVSGYSTGMSFSYCGNGVLHTPFVWHQLKNNANGTIEGGTFSGQPGCPGCQISVSNEQIIAPTSSDFWEEDDAGWVQCSIAGIFWHNGGEGAPALSSLIETAYLRASPTTWTCSMISGQQVCNITQFSSFCTAPTTPPDYMPHGLVTTDNPPSPYYDFKTVCYTFSLSAPYSWICFPTSNVKPLAATPPSGDCTKYPHAGGSNITTQ